ncbi:MAG: hypothetical protein EP318_04535 [Rhodobacteraceae bacterium]|nr:MAG: hypothetical protein EP318_04535 [Paracoccaceae bacterium]
MSDTSASGHNSAGTGVGRGLENRHAAVSKTCWKHLKSIGQRRRQMTPGALSAPTCGGLAPSGHRLFLLGVLLGLGLGLVSAFLGLVLFLVGLVLGLLGLVLGLVLGLHLGLVIGFRLGLLGFGFIFFHLEYSLTKKALP